MTGKQLNLAYETCSSGKRAVVRKNAVKEKARNRSAQVDWRYSLEAGGHSNIHACLLWFALKMLKT
jgi:hypothetical protein